LSQTAFLIGLQNSAAVVEIESVVLLAGLIVWWEMYTWSWEFSIEFYCLGEVLTNTRWMLTECLLSIKIWRTLLMMRC